jgi:hypothetical protein
MINLVKILKEKYVAYIKTPYTHFIGKRATAETFCVR